MENLIKLDSGTFLFNDYGKYNSGLSFILNDMIDIDSLYESVSFKDFNLENGSGYRSQNYTINMIRGDFWVSKKGSNCFKPNFQSGKHILLKDRWGCDKSYTSTLPSAYSCKDVLWSNWRNSNGGGSGSYYVILPFGWVNIVKAEDLEPEDDTKVDDYPRVYEYNNTYLKFLNEETLEKYVTSIVLQQKGLFIRIHDWKNLKYINLIS